MSDKKHTKKIHKATEAVCYIRVSDKNRGDDQTQLNAIEQYCKDNKLKVIDVVTEYVSASKTNVQDRMLQKVVDTLPEGVALVMTDVTRLGRRKIFDLLGVIGQITAKAELHLAYTGRVVNAANADDAETIFTIVGGSYAAVDESKKRSQRARAAVARRKSNGLHVGRKVGQKVRSKLDEHSMKIAITVKDKGNVSALAKELDCSRAQLYRWIDRNLTMAG
jgi:DNA invertase Pin-like site-specific DNA recombinase